MTSNVVRVLPRRSPGLRPGLVGAIAPPGLRRAFRLAGLLSCRLTTAQARPTARQKAAGQVSANQQVSYSRRQARNCTLLLLSLSTYSQLHPLPSAAIVPA